MVRRRYRTSGDVPRRGERVYDSRRELPADQPNGVVLDIHYPTQEVTVLFEKKTKLYDFDCFSGKWSDQFEGCWMLY